MKKTTDFCGDNLFVHFGICILMFILFSPFKKKEQELDGQEKVTCLLPPIDFPVPFSGSLVSPNYSSVFSSSLGWDIGHRVGLTVPQSVGGGLGR